MRKSDMCEKCERLQKRHSVGKPCASGPCAYEAHGEYLDPVEAEAASVRSALLARGVKGK